jgi:hypothetical protein
LVERAFALVLDRGRMRRVSLRGRVKVQKRYLIHVAGYNLELIMRLLTGALLALMLPNSEVVVVLVVLFGEQCAVLAINLQSDPLA